MDKNFKIEFTPSEKILSIHGSIDIPISHITKVSGELLDPTWKEIRMPGTSLPGVIKAGTYMTDRGAEFWYVTRNKKILRIELRDNFYKRVVLGLDDNSFWLDELAKNISH
jgi:hypothetical protein